MIKLLVVFAVLAYATAMPTNDSMTPYGFQNGSLFGNGSVLSENLSADEFNAIAGVLSSIKIQLWDNKKIFDVVMALKSDENLRSELLDSLKPIAGIMIDGLKEILFSDESKGAIMTLFTRFEEEISMVNGTLDFDMTPEENDNFNKEINYLMEELFANKSNFFVKL